MKNDENAMDVLPTLLCVISIVFFVIGFSISIQFLKAKKKKLAALSLIITIILILSFVGGIYYYINSIPNDIEYKLIIKTNTTGEYTLYVPYLDNSKLRSELEIQSGNGNFEIISIDKTPINSSNSAIKVNGQSDLTIYGKTDDKTWPEMSLETTDYFKNLNSHWVWCNKTNPDQNISIIIHASTSGRNVVYEWQTKSNIDATYENIEYIENGWNKVYIKKDIES